MSVPALELGDAYSVPCVLLCRVRKMSPACLFPDLAIFTGRGWWPRSGLEVAFLFKISDKLAGSWVMPLQRKSTSFISIDSIFDHTSIVVIAWAAWWYSWCFGIHPSQCGLSFVLFKGNLNFSIQKMLGITRKSILFAELKNWLKWVEQRILFTGEFQPGLVSSGGRELA